MTRAAPAPHVRTALALAALGLASACAPEPARVSGTVEPRRVVVSAEVAARVVRVAVREADGVRAGELLLELDDTAYAARADAAERRLDVARAELALLEAGSRPEEIAVAEAALNASREALALARAGARSEEVEQLEARLEANRAAAHLSRLDLARQQSLVESGVTSQAALDAANALVDSLAAERTRLEAQLREARAGARPEELRAREADVAAAEAHLELARQGARPEALTVARARVAAAAADLGAARVDVERCRVSAPLDAQVEVVDVEPGEAVQPGRSLVALARSGVLRVRSYASQAQLAALAPGDLVPLEVDGRPETRREARVERIWDQAEFTTGNVQTPSDRELLVFRVDLELAPEPAAGLRPGATVLLDFDGAHRP